MRLSITLLIIIFQNYNNFIQNTLFFSLKSFRHWVALFGLRIRQNGDNFCYWSTIYYNMNRCEHNQKITKFCITEHCHHKEAAGCDYCIRKYHFHLTSTLLLSETDVDNVIQNLTLPSDIKYKAKSFQESAIDYLRNIKITINSWIDQAQNSIAERLSYPTLRKQGLLASYNRLKQKQYRKINAKELRLVSQFAKNNSLESLKKQQLKDYYEEVEWTMSVAAAVEKLAAELSNLPEVKEGEGPIMAINKSKLNEIYESINKEKDKRDVQAKITGVQGNVSNQGMKLAENTLLKRRQSNEKKGFENNELANQFKEIIERKVEPLNDELEKPKFLIQREKSENQATNSISQKVDETKRELKRRKSSIDDKFEMKFGAGTAQDKVKENKELEQRKKRLLEKIEHQRKLSQDKLYKKDQFKPKIARQYSQKVRKEEESIMGNLLNLKLASKRQEFIIKQQQPSLTNSTQQQINKMAHVEKNKYTETQKFEVSQNKASENNFMGIVFGMINNILPPDQPTIPKKKTQDIFVQKVVKIPVMMNPYQHQIQSPIYKTKKKQQDKQSAGIPFGIVLMPTVDTAEQKIGQSTLTTVAQTRTKDESSVPGLPKNSQQTSALNCNQQNIVKQQQKVGDLIVLERNQKNSLLLFSQALKSPEDRAIQLLKAALKYSSQNLSAAEYLSYLYLQSGKSKECIQVCQSILSQIQDTPQQFELTLHLHNNKAAALNQLGRYSQSIMILQKCLRFRRKHYFYKNLGDAYFCLGIPEKAAMNYDKAIKLDPQSDEAYYNLAVTQFIQHQYTSAQLNINQALKIQPSNEAYHQLSQQVQKRLSNIVM